ncbi:asparaginase [Rothia sp. P13129]|uniref:asparaginase n=1 Tax=Rothia sp. P13129 TaxID=3402664 RepID=UPI003AC4D1C3
MQTFHAQDAVELAVVRRSGFVESRHLGSAVLLNADGSPRISYGDIDTPIFPRSALKPFQTIASMNAGAELQGTQIALASGSHTGSFEHMKVAQSILSEAELDDSALQCPSVLPSDQPSLNALIQAGKGAQRLAFNCSGKHSAFLWACVKNGWDVDRYLDPEHPLQQRVIETIRQCTQEDISTVGVDGCGAPLPALSLRALARGYSLLGSGIENIHADARVATVATAMVDYPEYLQGIDTPYTRLSGLLDAVVKGGAEGVLAIGLRDGSSLCIKILDGSHRALVVIALSILEQAGLITAQQRAQGIEQCTSPIMGADTVVGAVEPGAALQQEV